MKKHNTIALIPARGGSKSIPGKNLVDFCGRPLLYWTIAQAQASRFIRQVFVTSDSEEILDFSRCLGAGAIKRPLEFASDEASSESALSHAISFLEAACVPDIGQVVFLQATSPLRENKDIDEALGLFNSKKADSLFSGSVVDDCCLWKNSGAKLKSITYDYRNRGRRQEREPYLLENGSIYIFKPAVLRKFKNRLGGKIVFYPMPPWKSFEIDKKEDMDICAFFMKNNILKKVPAYSEGSRCQG